MLPLLLVLWNFEPEARIVGPERVAMGDLCVLDGTTSQGSGHVWKLVGTDKTALPVDEGRRLVFASGTPGRYTFVLAVADEGRASLASHVLEVAGPAPPGPPGPPTPVPPTPDPPSGRFDLSRASRNAALAVQLEPTTRRTTARSLAAAHRSVASATRAGAFVDLNKILEERRAACHQAVGAYQTAWTPWNQELTRKLNELHSTSKMRTPSDFADAFDEIAVGLESL